MPVLDSCITGVYTPGNIPASPGEPPTQVVLGSFYDPEIGGVLPIDYGDLTFSLDYTKFYNSFYFLMGFV